MSKTKVRKSIWGNGIEFQRYQGEGSGLDDCSNVDLQVLRYVEHAKKQAGVISTLALVEINKLIKSLPNSNKLTYQSLAMVLRSICKHDAIEYRIAFCMIARMKQPNFAPLDNYVILGLFSLGKLDNTDCEVFKKSNYEEIAKIYLKKILPLWKKELADGRQPSDIDSDWISEGKAFNSIIKNSKKQNKVS